jgi:FixJ family two-component response regulator
MSASAAIMNTIHIVDDEPALRRALARVLESDGNPVRCCESASEFLDGLDTTSSGCVLLDVAMPGMDGLALQERLREVAPQLPVIFLTGRGDIAMSVRAMKAGAIDFLTKPVRRADLLRAVHAAVDRTERLRQDHERVVEARMRIERLTPRELEVMRHVLAGQLNKVIADRLGTAEGTVKVHRARMMEKLGLESVPDLVRFASLAGISPAEGPEARG